MASEPTPKGASDRLRPHTYREAAPYVESFLAYLSLQEVLRGRGCFEVDVVASGLEEEDEQMLM